MVFGSCIQERYASHYKSYKSGVLHESFHTHLSDSMQTNHVARAWSSNIAISRCLFFFPFYQNDHIHDSSNILLQIILITPKRSPEAVQDHIPKGREAVILNKRIPRRKRYPKYLPGRVYHNQSIENIYLYTSLLLGCSNSSDMY